MRDPGVPSEAEFIELLDDAVDGLMRSDQGLGDQLEGILDEVAMTGVLDYQTRERALILRQQMEDEENILEADETE